MKFITQLLLITCAFALSATTSAADDVRYVSDVLHLPLRSGKGNEFRITHRGMPSSTKLFVLEEDEENGWMRVRTEKDVEGWVRSQYLIAEPTAAIKLAALEKKVSNLNSGSKQLLKQISDAEANNKSLNAELSTTKSQLNLIEKELNSLKKVSAGAIDLDKQHQKLLTKYQMLQTESDTTHAENQRLESNKNHNQWMFGALLVGCGIIVTLILQSLSMRRRKSDWG